MGYRKVSDVIQTESIDGPLLNSLWNAIWKFYYSNYFSSQNYLYPGVDHDSLKELTIKIWIDLFKEPIDELDFYTAEPINILKNYFFDVAEWYDVYDLVEFIPNNFDGNFILNEEFLDYCNQILEREVSAYRFVAGKLVKITTEEEIQEIEDTINNPSTNDLVKKHITNGLSLMADRESPDYRNSIKESISAVECIAKAIAGDPNTTLGKVLNEIEKSGTIEFHSDLKEGLKKIYHYTSDDSGIRHALKDKPTVSFDDAKFMLVICSAFCNYLAAKADKAGIQIK
jgi:AbiJ N-terminal domain 4